MSHSIDSCPLIKLAGGFSKLQSADDDAVAWPIEDAHDNNNNNNNNRFRTSQLHCACCRKKWGLAATDMCPCGKRQTMSHIVNSCPQSKLEAAAVTALS